MGSLQGHKCKRKKEKETLNIRKGGHSVKERPIPIPKLPPPSPQTNVPQIELVSRKEGKEEKRKEKCFTSLSTTNINTKHKQKHKQKKVL
jgi:hypothetical protein